MIDWSILYGLFFALLVVSDQRQYVHAKPLVPCYFIFGDSLVDSGNNNKLQTTAKVNYSPYGIDFPGGPTGRYTNGRTTADLFGEFMGIDDFIRPFATANGTRILEGVNYASGTSGILDETAHHLGSRVPLNQQLRNHRTTIFRINDILGNKSIAQRHLHQCLYLVVTGSNDYINNYFLPHLYNTSNLYTPKQFARFLINKYAKQIKTLYDYGARKIALTSAALIGCTPNATAFYDTEGSICVDKMNNAAFLFNKELQTLVDILDATLSGAKVVNLKTFSIIAEYVTTQVSPVQLTACCPVNEYGLCIPNKHTCENRALALFWDSFHPSELLNRVTSSVSFNDLKPIF